MDYNDEHGFSSYETDEDTYNMYNKLNNNKDNEKKQNNNRKKGIRKFYFVILCISFLVTSLSITISFFTSSSRSKLIHEIESAVVNFSLKVEKISEDTDKGLVPLNDNEIENALLGTNGKKCIDKDNNNVCQIYKINIENISNYGTKFKANLNLSATKDSNYENLKWAEISYSDAPKIFGDIKPMSNTNLKSSYGVGGGTSASFYIVIWISDNGKNQNKTDFGSFTGSVSFEAVSGDKLTSSFSNK